MRIRMSLTDCRLCRFSFDCNKITMVLKDIPGLAFRCPIVDKGVDKDETVEEK